jgi:hypothetical protein
MSSKDEAFLKGKKLGGRPAVVEQRITKPVRLDKPRVLSPQEWKFVEEFGVLGGVWQHSKRLAFLI